jgi:hypothetical protein
METRRKLTKPESRTIIELRHLASAKRNQRTSLSSLGMKFEKKSLIARARKANNRQQCILGDTAYP